MAKQKSSWEIPHESYWQCQLIYTTVTAVSTCLRSIPHSELEWLQATLAVPWFYDEWWKQQMMNF
jgi:hypothetical protein